MGRSFPAYLVVSALLGLSGCLLFTDPINRAPEVMDVRADGPIVRGEEVGFTATFRDDEDSRSLDIQWAVFSSDSNHSCNTITKASWEGASLQFKSLPSDLPFFFAPEALEVTCVCVKAKDRHGASSFACQRVQATYRAPVARIVDASDPTGGERRALCSSIHLVAKPERSTFPKDDQVQYNWELTYSLTEPVAKAPQLVECAGVTDKALADQHRCIDARVPGTYTVSLSITNAPQGHPPESSNTAQFVTTVLPDAPPCLQQTDPDAHAQRILLSRSTDLGSTYQSRTFKVLSVAGDCEQYPPVSGKKSPQFVWSLYDATQPTPQWVYQAYTGDSFPISQTTFPKALPGDIIKLRVEVRDEAVQQGYLSGIHACESEQLEICCGPSGCGSVNDCVRWTTWTVQFLP